MLPVLYLRKKCFQIVSGLLIFGVGAVGIVNKPQAGVGIIVQKNGVNVCVNGETVGDGVSQCLHLAHQFQLCRLGRRIHTGQVQILASHIAQGGGENGIDFRGKGPDHLLGIGAHLAFIGTCDQRCESE